MFVVFLGTGNALPSVDRANTALALSAHPGAGVTLIDCGGDPYRNLMRAGIAPERVNAVIITHAHIDHIAGLPSLIESFRIADRTTSLHIYAIAHPLGIVRDLLRLFAFELTLETWPFTVELHEITPDVPSIIGDFTVTPIAMEHTVPSVGLRCVATSEPDSPIFAYSSDTQVNPALHELARDASLFVAEATYPLGNEDAARQVRHMTAHQAAEIAQAAGAHALGLVHLSVTHAQERGVRHEARRAFFGEVHIPRDGTVVQIGHRVRQVPRLP